MEAVAFFGVHDLFQEQGLQGGDERLGFLVGRAGPGDPVEGKAVEQGDEGAGHPLRFSRPERGEDGRRQAFEGGERLGDGGTERRVASGFQVHLVLGDEHAGGPGDEGFGQPIGDVAGAGAARGERHGQVVKFGHPFADVQRSASSINCWADSK